MARRTKLWRFLRFALLATLLAAAGFTLYLDFRVRDEFEGRRFALPARIFARPLELHVGLRMPQADVVDELKLLGYRDVARPGEPGWYPARGEPPGDRAAPVRVLGRRAAGAQRERRLRRRQGFDAARRAPARTCRSRASSRWRSAASIPAGNEDRVLVRLTDVPQHLVQALIAVEDRSFYRHAGFDLRGLARAARSVFTDRVQGGSTITQQLVKNFFLTPERTLRRKATELVMAVLLEIHYDKNEILETYLNEIYFGQDRDRAIHGVGLAAQFYFGKDVQYLSVAESALLVGMIRGPAHYDPYKHAARTLERRNLVLRETRDQGQITLEQYASARAEPARRDAARAAWAPRPTRRSSSSCTGSCGATTTRRTCARKACASSPRSIRARRARRRTRSPSAWRSSTRRSASASRASKARW